MSTSSADPADMQTFINQAMSALNDLIRVEGNLPVLRSMFAHRDGQGVDDSSGQGAMRQYLSDGKALDTATKTIRHKFLEADSGPGTRTIPDSIISTALANKGQGIPSEPPATVEAPQLTGQPVSSGVSDDPVNVANGNFVEQETDLEMPGRASAISWRRSYNSRVTATVGALGRGWSCWADSALVAEGENLRWIRPDGKALIIPGPVADEPQDMPGGNGTIAVTGDGHTITRIDPPGSWEFSAAGRPVRVIEGNTEAVQVWEDGRLVRMEHPRSGRSLAVGWSTDHTGADRIDTVTTSDGRIVSYDYTGDGDLYAADGPESGRRTYEWAAGFLVAVTDADGILVVRNSYDDEGRVLTQLSPYGRLSRYVYRPGRNAVVTDSEGAAFNGYQHDEAGNLIALTDDAGNTLRREFDDHGRLVAITSRAGGRFSISYDDAGNPIAETDPAGAIRTTAWDTLGRPVERTDRTSRSVRMSYRDALRTPISVTDAAGTTTLDVDEDDLVRRVVDPDGVWAEFDWDSDGQLQRVRTLAGEAAVTRDAAGQVIALDGPGGLSAHWELDSAGRTLGQADALDRRWQFSRSSAGRPLRVEDPAGQPVGNSVGGEWERRHAHRPTRFRPWLWLRHLREHDRPAGTGRARVPLRLRRAEPCHQHHRSGRENHHPQLRRGRKPGAGDSALGGPLEQVVRPSGPPR